MGLYLQERTEYRNLSLLCSFTVKELLGFRTAEIPGEHEACPPVRRLSRTRGVQGGGRLPDGGDGKYVTGTGCIPDILGEVWLDTQANCCVGDEEELVVGRSFLACSHGGFIEIQSSGSEYNGDLDDGEIKPVDHSSMQDELHEGLE